MPSQNWHIDSHNRCYWDRKVFKSPPTLVICLCGRVPSIAGPRLGLHRGLTMTRYNLLLLWSPDDRLSKAMHGCILTVVTVATRCKLSNWGSVRLVSDARLSWGNWRSCKHEAIKRLHESKLRWLKRTINYWGVVWYANANCPHCMIWCIMCSGMHL